MFRDRAHGPAPSHFCRLCGALWRQCDNGNWNLRSKKCGPCCDNAPMGEQITPLLAEVDRINELVSDLRANEKRYVAWTEDQMDENKRLRAALLFAASRKSSDWPERCQEIVERARAALKAAGPAIRESPLK